MRFEIHLAGQGQVLGIFTPEDGTLAQGQVIVMDKRVKVSHKDFNRRRFRVISQPGWVEAGLMKVYVEPAAPDREGTWE